MKISQPLKGGDEGCKAISPGRSEIGAQPFAEKVGRGAFICSRDGTGPLPSTLLPLSGSSRDVRCGEETQEDVNSAQFPSETPVGLDPNPDKRK
ncbi:hypothetical protein U1Q18_022950, partial [Sarracenia purpurea var. burkii]